MNVSINGTSGDLWVTTDGKDHGPFKTVLDATFTAVTMVTDSINAEYAMSPAVIFVDPKVFA